MISEEYGNGRTAVEIAARAIFGGADIVQMREKNKSVQELLDLGEDILALCRKSGAAFIVNDDPTLAEKIGADGVHLGQEDARQFPVERARGIIGPDKIIGLSTHSLDQLRKANEEDVDYVAFGPIFPTKTKAYHIGVGDIKEVMGIAKKPVFFIGGINLINIKEVLTRGAHNIALIRGVTEANDIEIRTRQFKEKLVKQKGGRKR